MTYLSTKRLSVLSAMLVSKAATVALMSPESPKSTGVRLPMCLGVPVDLDFLHFLAREELRKGEFGTEHQQEVGFVNGAIGSAVTEQTGHTDRVRIVMLQPLFAAERIADRRFQFSRQLDNLVAGVPATIPPEDRHVFASSIIFVSLLRSASEGRYYGGAGICDAEGRADASADATSPGIEITAGPLLSDGSGESRWVTIGRTCSGLTRRPT